MKKATIIVFFCLIILLVFSPLKWKDFCYLSLADLFVFLFDYFIGKTRKELPNTHSKKQRDYFKGEYDYRGRKITNEWVGWYKETEETKN